MWGHLKVKLKSQKHRPTATLITRTDCSYWLHNTTPSSTVLSSLISSIPNKLCFFASLPSSVCTLQTTAYKSSSMNFAAACSPVCLGNVKLSRASCPIQQTSLGYKHQSSWCTFLVSNKEPVPKHFYVISCLKLILLRTLAKKDPVIHFKNQKPQVWPKKVQDRCLPFVLLHTYRAPATYLPETILILSSFPTLVFWNTVIVQSLTCQSNCLFVLAPISA